MNPIVWQVLLAFVSWLGVPVGWLAGHGGQRRIRQPLAGIVTNLGPLIMMAPWIALPLLAQPHLTGPLRTITLITGIVLLVAVALVLIWATPFIFPSAKKGGCPPLSWGVSEPSS